MKKIYGNFKMNTTIEQFESYANNFLPLLNNNDNEVALFVPFSHIYLAKQKFANSTVKIGAQDLSVFEKGAYTGDVSAEMLKSLMCDCVLVGHSERRNVFGDSNEKVNAKLLNAKKNNIDVVLCIGETLEEKQTNKTFDVLEKQIESALCGVDTTFFEHITIAYEPVYAIGSGIVPKLQEIAEIALFVKKFYKEKYGFEFDLLYGGSANGANKDELLGVENIDGLLVGGACLDAQTFANMAK